MIAILPLLTPEVMEKFLARVDRSGPTQPHMTTRCWPWGGGLSGCGYGYVNIGGHTLKANRVAYVVDRGRDPPDDRPNVLHKCDHRLCCRPDHLVCGTLSRNTREMHARGRGGWVLTPEAVLEIVRLRRNRFSLRVIAELHGTTAPTIAGIMSGRRWSKITGIVRRTVDNVNG